MASRFTILHHDRSHLAAVPGFYQRGFIFNEPKHISQQSDGPFYVITAFNTATGQAEARCTFFPKSPLAVSPFAAPFGSIEFSETLPDTILNDFLNVLHQTASEAGAHALRIVNYPHCYAPKQADKLTELLTEHGFTITETHQNAYLTIADKPFEHSLVAAERRRLRKCQQANFVFTQWIDPDISAVTSFIAETRHLQRYSLPLSAERLADLFRLFPNEFSVFMVSDCSTITALTVAVRVREDILYNFLPASHPNYSTFSPMVMLIGGLFAYCQQQDIRLLDLGVSLDGDHQPKPSLVRFKQNLGGQASPKLVFEKQL